MQDVHHQELENLLLEGQKRLYSLFVVRRPAFLAVNQFPIEILDQVFLPHLRQLVARHAILQSPTLEIGPLYDFVQRNLQDLGQFVQLEIIGVLSPEAHQPARRLPIEGVLFPGAENLVETVEKQFEGEMVLALLEQRGEVLSDVQGNDWPKFLLLLNGQNHCFSTPHYFQLFLETWPVAGIHVVHQFLSHVSRQVIEEGKTQVLQVVLFVEVLEEGKLEVPHVLFEKLVHNLGENFIASLVPLIEACSVPRGRLQTQTLFGSFEGMLLHRPKAVFVAKDIGGVDGEVLGGLAKTMHSVPRLEVRFNLLF